MTSTPHSRRPRPTAPTSARCHPRSVLLAELDREWARLTRRPRSLLTLRTWVDDGHLSLRREVRTLDELVAATQPSTADDPIAERTLRELVALAAKDDLAGRVVLQRVLPGLIRGASRWRTWSSATEPIDVVIGAAWIAIRSFDLADRSSLTAPSLISDSLWSAFRREARQPSRAQATPDHVLVRCAAPPPRLDPVVALAAAVRAAADAGVAAEDLDLVRTIARANGPKGAARALGVTQRTVRNHRDAATSRIRRALGPDWHDGDHQLTVAA